MTKRRATKTENTMSDLSNTEANFDANLDPLADLGLDTAGAESGTESNSEEDNVAKGKRPIVDEDDDMDFGEIEVGVAAEVPTARRTGGSGSRFPFAKLAAPTTNAKGEPEIAFFTVPYKAAFDKKKFARSVQSATTQANRSSAAEGKYFESRSVVVAGEFVGISVYRTDNRPDDEAAGE